MRRRTVRADDTRELSDFRDHAAEHLDRLERAGGVEVLTVDGQAKGVVMSPRVFDELVGRAEQAETDASVGRGLADAAAGRTRPARQAIAALAAELGLDLDRHRP